jgi:hypothetical protein
MSNNLIDNINCSTSSCAAVGDMSNNAEVMVNGNDIANSVATRRTSSRPKKVPVTRDSKFLW